MYYISVLVLSILQSSVDFFFLRQYCVAQVGLELYALEADWIPDLPASTSWLLGSQALTPCLIYSVMGLEPRASWVLSASDLPVWSSRKFLRDNTLLVGCLVSFSISWAEEYQESSGGVSPTALRRFTEAQRQHCLDVSLPTPSFPRTSSLFRKHT